jgi:hypothetical protein
MVLRDTVYLLKGEVRILTLEEIREQLYRERKIWEIRSTLWGKNEDPWVRYEQGYLLTDSKALDDFNRSYEAYQRNLNRQKKLLSLYRKKLLSTK